MAKGLMKLPGGAKRGPVKPRMRMRTLSPKGASAFGGGGMGAQPMAFPPGPSPAGPVPAFPGGDQTMGGPGEAGS